VSITNRVELHNVTVRFFHDRNDAIRIANMMTRTTEAQHRSVSTPHGYLVERGASPRTVFDAGGGEVPPSALVDLPIRR
jgi:hypothetical protein